MNRRKILSICLTVVMIMSVLALAGCGSKKEEEPKPTNAQELLDASKKASKEVDNFSLAGNGKIEIKAGVQGSEMSVPITFDGTGDISKDVIHAKANASMTMMGQEQKVAPEVYVDIKNKKTYSKTSEDEDWTSSDLDLDTEKMQSVEIPESIKTDLAFSETDEAYVLESDLTKIDLKELIKSVSENQEGAEQIDQALDAIDQAKIAINSGKLTMTYDKETYLIKSVTIKELAGSGSSEIAEGQNMDITATADIELTFSDYGKVAADKFKLPEVGK